MPGGRGYAGRPPCLVESGRFRLSVTETIILGSRGMSEDYEALEADALAVLDVEGKMRLLRTGADARRRREEAKEALAGTERDYSAAHAAMVRGGWSEAQLIKLGFEEPEVSPKGRVRRRRGAATSARSAAPASARGESGTPSSDSGTAASPVAASGPGDDQDSALTSGGDSSSR